MLQLKVTKPMSTDKYRWIHHPEDKDYFGAWVSVEGIAELKTLSEGRDIYDLSDVGLRAFSEVVRYIRNARLRNVAETYKI